MKQIVTVGESAELVLNQAILRQIGAGAGDQVEIKLTGRTLTVRTLDEVERAQKIATITKDIFDRRREAYEVLAQGPTE